MKNTMGTSRTNYCFLILITLLFLGFNSNNSFAQKKGKIDYDEKFEEKNGMIRVKAGDKFGYLSAKGKTVIEPIYEYAEDFDENGFAIVKTTHYSLINKEGLSQLNNMWTGIKYYPQWKRYLGNLGSFGHYIYDEKLSPITMDDKYIISDINANGIGICKNANIDYYILVDLKTGLLNENITYDRIYDEQNGFRTYERKIFGELECGYFDANGNLIEEVYDNAFDYSVEGVAVVERDGMSAYIDLQGKILHDFTLNAARTFENGKGPAIKNGKPGFVNLKGEFSEVKTVEWGEIGKESNGLRSVTLFKKYGYINKDNILGIPLLYDIAYTFKDGIAVVKQFGKLGSIDINGEVIVPIKYDYVANVNEEMILVREGKLYGYYTDKGVLVSKIEFDKAEDFSSGLASITLGEKSGKIDKTGKITWEKSTIYTEVIDKTKWAADEKLKNVIDAKTFAAVPTQSETGIQISKNGVDNRKMSYYLNSLGYKDGLYLGPYTESSYDDAKKGIAFNLDSKDQSKSGFVVSSEIPYGKILKSKSGKFIGLGYTKIQEFDIVNENVEFGNYINVNYELEEFCEATNDIIVAIATDKNYFSGSYAALNDLYLIIWDRKNKLVSTFLIYDGPTSYLPKVASCNDGNIVIAFDARPNSETHRTTFEKIDVNTSLKTGKLKSVWKRTYSTADNYKLTDLIVDTKGNVVTAYKSFEKEAEFSDDDKTKFKYAELAIVKCNSNGEEFRNHVTKYVEPDLWGRSSDGGNLEMRNQENIYFSSNEDPKILQNPKGDGYIVSTRFSYGLWVWSTTYQRMSDEYKAMYADQPAFAIIDENSLKVTSVDFIETTAGDYSHDFSKYKIKNQLGAAWDIIDFQYNDNTNDFVILERSTSDDAVTHIWTFLIKIVGDWSGESSSNNEETSVTTNSTSTTGTKTNTTSTTSNSTTKEKDYIGSVYFKYDMMGSNSAPERLYIHYGSNGAYKTSTSKGSAATVKCQEGKVYYSLTGEKSDMKEFMEMSVDDCGKTFKYTEFK